MEAQIPEQNILIRFRNPLSSLAIDRMFFGIIPPGIYKGFVTNTVNGVLAGNGPFPRLRIIGSSYKGENVSIAAAEDVATRALLVINYGHGQANDPMADFEFSAAGNYYVFLEVKYVENNMSRAVIKVVPVSGNPDWSQIPNHAVRIALITVNSNGNISANTTPPNRTIPNWW